MRALVTGGNRGIGLAIVEQLLGKGHQVWVLCRDASSLSSALREQVRVIEHDLCEVAGIRAALGDLEVDLLVNNAGIMCSEPWNAYPLGRKLATLAINLEAPIELMTVLGERMAAQGSGRIVNNASIAGQVGHPDVWYGATKAALINATRSFALLLAPQGVMVSAVAPGPVETRMLGSIPPERLEAMRGKSYDGRFATPENVADVMVWLGTEAPMHLNGFTIDINNGAFRR